MKKFLLLAATALLLASCDKDTTDPPYLVDSDYVVTAYASPAETLSLIPISGHTTSTMFDLAIRIEKTVTRHTDKTEFEALAKKYGDQGYQGEVLRGGQRSLQQTITGISIVALTDFNDSHPAGSSLNDIAQLTYASYKPFIDNGFKQPTDSHVNIPQSRYPEIGLLAYYDKPLSEITAIPLPQLWPVEHYVVLATVSFAEEPTNPDAQFSVSITLDNGQTIKTEQ